MISISTAVSHLLFGKNDCCCLCFKPATLTAISFYDEIIIKANDTQDTVDVSELLSYVLGREIFEKMTTEFVCDECLTQAINSYTFIKSSKENMQLLYNTIKSLNSCFEPRSQLESNCNSLFIALNTKDFTSQQYYDKRRQVASLPAALKRFQSISKVKSKRYNTTDEKDFSISPDHYYVKTEKKINYRKRVKCKMILEKHLNEMPQIHTCDMLLDANDWNNIRCKECLQKYRTHSYLRRHFIRVHAPKIFKCLQCPRSYGSATLLEQHRNDSHCTIVCSECGKTFNNRHTLKMHESSHNMRLVCQACGRVYKNRNTFRNHLEHNICEQKTRKPVSQGDFVCDVCSKRYSHKNSLRVHINYEHGNAKSFACSWCNKKFWHQSRLKAHIVKHTQEKKYPCEICGGKFVTKTSLLYHTRRHTGEKPYPCEMCDQRFISASRRVDHVKRHHTYELHECDICNSNFRHRADLIRHKKGHLMQKES